MVCGILYGYKYKMILRKLIVVEKRMTWENVMDLRPRGRRVLDYKYRVNVDRG